LCPPIPPDSARFRPIPIPPIPPIRHARYVIFQMAEVAVPKRLFRGILERIRRLRLPETVPR